MADMESQTGSPFWRFSLRFYRLPGVADACIALQDGCGVDVNILLFLLWLATTKRRVPPGVAQAVCAQAAAWRDDVRGAAAHPAAQAQGWIGLGRARYRGTVPHQDQGCGTRGRAVAAGGAVRPRGRAFHRTGATVEAAARANVAAYEHVVGHTFAEQPVQVLIATLLAHDRDDGAGLAVPHG